MISHNHILTIESDNTDVCNVCGTWNAIDVEAEMINLEIPLENEHSWLEYVLDHVFEDYDYDINTEALATVLEIGEYCSTVELQFNGVQIKIWLIQ